LKLLLLLLRQQRLLLGCLTWLLQLLLRVLPQRVLVCTAETRTA
jgi:hypothetical protein